MDVAVARKVLQMFGRFELVCSGFVDAVVHCFQCGELDSRASQKDTMCGLLRVAHHFMQLAVNVIFGDAASLRIRINWDSSSSLDISINPANIANFLDVESYLDDAESDSSIHLVIRPRECCSKMIFTLKLFASPLPAIAFKYNAAGLRTRFSLVSCVDLICFS